MPNLCSPLISVIIPCYNNEDTIKETLESVISQSYCNLEIICIDDGSQDNTINILNKFKKKINEFKLLINTRNRGPSYTRNRGISVAQGCYVAFLDADDYWHPQKIEIQFNIMKKQNWNFIGASFKKDLTISNKPVNTNEMEYKSISFNKLLFKNYFSTPSVLIKKNILLPFDNSQKYSEDYKLWLNILRNKHTRAGIITKPILVGLNKESYGASGLSASIWSMEKYELKNYWDLLKKGHLLTLFAIPYSILKHIRRLIIIKYRNYHGKQ